MCNLIFNDLLYMILKENNIYCSKFLSDDISSLLELNQ